MSRDQTLNGYQLAQPEWCGDFLGREQLVPGGAKVDAAAFVAYTAQIVTVRATVAQAYAGTGNGVMSALTVPTGAVPEVWTITLTNAAANGGTFSVVGSISGAKANAVVGVAYDNGSVAFTIADGSTDFIVGDKFTVTTSRPAAAAVSLPVVALPQLLAPGSTLNFGIPGQMAYAPNGAAQGATTIVVAPLDRAIDNGLTANVDGTTHKTCPSGTVLGRTFAERAAGTPYGIAADADEEFAIAAFTRVDLDKINDVDLVRPFAGVVVKENFLPNFSTLSATVKAAVRARYVCTIGRP